MSNRRQAIFGSHGGQLYWRIYASLGLDELMHFIAHWTGFSCEYCVLLAPNWWKEVRDVWYKKQICHDDVIKWKHFPRYWPFVWGIHRFPVNSPHKGQWRGALMFSLICAWINGWVNNREAGDLRRLRAHYDVMVMLAETFVSIYLSNEIFHFVWL